MSSMLTLAVYSAGIFAAAILGGRLSALATMTHLRTQMLMSLVAGFILAIAIFHLLPHSLAHIPGPGAVNKAVGWTMAGMLLMVFLLRIFQFHRHDFSDEAGDYHGHGHGEEESEGESGTHPRRLLGIAFGLGVHTVTEGVALGTTVRLGATQAGGEILAGMGVFLAILLHKPLDAYSIVGLMKLAGYGPRALSAANVGFALLCPLVALVSFLGVGLLDPFGAATTAGYVLAFAAGAFLCIALSDLLPEIHFHSHDRGKLILALVVGIGLAYALRLVEAAAHGVEGH
ncbi:MAG: ZIP family metal transporter [Gemmatimonadaceae bacterium]|nr:ZIP family metal transporter [Gemmatimonadaceae bacterium]